MMTVAIWLAFFSLLPVVFWLFSMLFDRLRHLVVPSHKIEVEFIDESGASTVEVINVSSDMEFYRVAMGAIRAGRTVRDGKHDSKH